jgi:diadenosine tetraphosphate (Ap4A) HIT family hydrolase
MREVIMEGQPSAIEDSNAPWDSLVEEDFHVKVFSDKYPVTEGHLLFVPKYNTVSVLMNAFEDAVRDGMRMVEAGECDGFNVGFNYGATAGQTVGWPHVHLIPRRNGDMEDPTGGVRHVIPERGNYRKW